MSALSNRSTTNPSSAGFGVYVHWPFCAAKCPYCDFNSHVRHGGVDQDAFREAFVAEIRSAAAETGPRTVDSIFFGGGTPSLMPAATVDAILSEIAANWSVAPDAEITLEANPTSVEADRFRDYRGCGVNRVSLGVQSLNDRDLKALGRLHSADEARAAVAIANRVFDRVSFDLIYARTGQTVEQWKPELDEALALSAGHLSLYQLTIEPGTPFETLHAAGKLTIPDPEMADALYDFTRDRCAAAGLPLYEISNHARPAEESRHNLLYWRYGEYVGVGPGAHGRPIIDGQRRATVTERHPETWLKRVADAGDGRTDAEPLEAVDLADEMLLMGLRLAEGVDLVRLEEETSASPAQSVIDDLVSDGLLERIGNRRIAASPEGRFVLNRLVLMLSESFSFAAGPSPEVPQPISKAPA